MASTAAPVETAEREERPTGGRRGRVLRAVGKTCLTAAFVLAAYIVWLLWGTGFYTARQQEGLRRQLEARIAQRDPTSAPADPTILPGRAYAILRIPSIDVDEVVVEGTDIVDLKSGPGHYANTDDPWDGSGRVAIAGHRTTYGAPFWDLDRVREGDGITLVTERGTYRYTVTDLREVLPTAGSVLRPSREPSLVLTTCTPKFSAARRLIVFADLDGVRA